jgi:TolA-binding protein
MANTDPQTNMQKQLSDKDSEILQLQSRIKQLENEIKTLNAAANRNNCDTECYQPTKKTFRVNEAASSEDVSNDDDKSTDNVAELTKAFNDTFKLELAKFVMTKSTDSNADPPIRKVRLRNRQNAA